MGPRSFNRGNQVGHHGHVVIPAASMGPRSFNRGNVATAGAIAARSAGASMGPRSFNRGNDCEGAGHRPRTHRFNGAAVFQPRKCEVCRADNEARKALQWGRGLSTAEILRVPAFPLRPRHASMGPRSFNRGNAGELPTAIPLEPASMGPRSFNRGNLPLPPRESPVPPTLQWGRGLSTAEMVSMGCTPQLTSVLQWGRGLSTAEMRSHTRRASIRRSFNGAAVFQPRKSSRSRV